MSFKKLNKRERRLFDKLVEEDEKQYNDKMVKYRAMYESKDNSNDNKAVMQLAITFELLSCLSHEKLDIIPT